jgi:hypothetical protein
MLMQKELARKELATVLLHGYDTECRGFVSETVVGMYPDFIILALSLVAYISSLLFSFLTTFS